MSCYRVYDADMPEYAVAVDMYGELRACRGVQGASSGVGRGGGRRDGWVKFSAALPEALGIAAEDIVYKQRQSGSAAAEQYEKQGSKGELS